MPQVFKCIACSAPLEFEGAMMQKCRFCGSTVIVPAEMFHQPSTATPPSTPLSSDLKGLKDKAQKLAEIQRLLASGNKINAIKEFHETFGVGLKQAKDAVDALERGEPLNFTHTEMAPAPTSRKRPYVPTPESEALRSIARDAGGARNSPRGGSRFLVLSAVIALAAAAATVFFLVGEDPPDEVKRSAAVTATERKPEPAAEEAPPVTELLRIGGEGIGAGRFKDNRHVAVDGEGRIYSGDYSGHRIQAFDKEGKFLHLWQLPENTSIFDMAADRKGRVYILHNRGILMYNGEDGKLIRKNDEGGHRGLAVMLDGSLAAAGRGGITIYNDQLRPIRTFKDASTQASSGSGFEHIAVDGNGEFYLTERISADVIRFSSDGRFVNRFKREGTRANGIAVDPEGRIYLSLTSSIEALDQYGRLVKTFPARQAFRILFNDEGDLFVAARPFILKQKLHFNPE